ncbi:MAG TPA: hypothetical protein VFU81_00170, partial [Thermomicrobiales bacterium]|nr:hypothetical protein [Thermomicrobiales bacterium]
MATSTIDPAEAERETPTPAMPRVLLISMPFATTMRPSIGLGLLKAGLARRGMPCDVRYCNLRYADRIGVETYERISNFSRDPLLGEWIFAEDVFGAAVPEPERYFESVLRPCLERPFHRDRSEADLPPPEALFAALVRLRRQATQFLDECEASIPWPNYGLVGFTTTFEQNLASLALSRRIKSRHPEIAIAFGGANCEGEMGAALHRLFP